ncbi:MAG: hypothetical protein IT174_14910 [Acidobacteria bacterium]|nr:hypothetical protein [Acidobacteriota bacterium]
MSLVIVHVTKTRKGKTERGLGLELQEALCRAPKKLLHVCEGGRESFSR